MYTYRHIYIHTYKKLKLNLTLTLILIFRKIKHYEHCHSDDLHRSNYINKPSTPELISNPIHNITPAYNEKLVISTHLNMIIHW